MRGQSREEAAEDAADRITRAPDTAEGFSPGEWYANHVHVSAFTGDTITTTDGSKVSLDTCIAEEAGGRTVEEAIANARLLAAAPKMYRALCALLESDEELMRATPNVLKGHPAARELHAENVKAREAAREAILKAVPPDDGAE
jgi:hypothetical protein